MESRMSRSSWREGRRSSYEGIGDYLIFFLYLDDKMCMLDCIGLLLFRICHSNRSFLLRSSTPLLLSGCECPQPFTNPTFLSNFDAVFSPSFPSVFFVLHSNTFSIPSLPFLFLRTAPFPLCCNHNKHTHSRPPSPSSLFQTRKPALSETCPPLTKFPPTTPNSSSNVSRTSKKTDWYSFLSQLMSPSTQPNAN